MIGGYTGSTMETPPTPPAHAVSATTFGGPLERHLPDGTIQSGLEPKTKTSVVKVAINGPGRIHERAATEIHNLFAGYNNNVTMHFEGTCNRSQTPMPVSIKLGGKEVAGCVTHTPNGGTCSMMIPPGRHLKTAEIPVDPVHLGNPDPTHPDVAKYGNITMEDFKKGVVPTDNDHVLVPVFTVEPDGTHVAHPAAHMAELNREAIPGLKGVVGQENTVAYGKPDEDGRSPGQAYRIPQQHFDALCANLKARVIDQRPAKSEFTTEGEHSSVLVFTGHPDAAP